MSFITECNIYIMTLFEIRCVVTKDVIVKYHINQSQVVSGKSRKDSR